MNMTKDVALALWDRALKAELGIAFPLADAKDLARVKDMLKVTKEPRHEGIKVTLMKNGEVWLVKETVKLEG